MKDYIEINLLPVGIKLLMSLLKKIAICAEIFILIILVALWCGGCFDTTTTGIVISMMLHLITLPMLILGLAFNKTSQSTVKITEELISVYDKKGNCWRTILPNTITDIRIEEISDFFYGRNRHTFRFEYVCLFLNGNTQIPDVSFSKLFFEKDFIMFGYDEVAFDMIKFILAKDL